MTPLKVAIDATPLLGNKSGIGIVTEAVVRRLANSSLVDLTGFLVSYSGGEELRRKLPKSVNAKHIRFPARFSHLLWENISWPSVTGFDVVHGINFVCPPSPGSVEVLTIHDLTAWRYPELLSTRNRSFPKLVERALSRGAHVHVVSDFVAGEVESVLNVPRDRITVVANGNSVLSKGDPAEAKAIVDGDYILSIGTIEPRKDYPTLIEAMESIWEIFPDLQLVIAGGKGWGANEVQEAIQSSSKPKQIILAGYVSDEMRSSLLQGALLLAYPSIYEGFGLPILEAMSAGTPVVATQIGAITEVAGDAAMLVPPKSSAALASGIVEVIEDVKVRDYLKATGLRRSSAYSWDNTADQLISMYQKLCS